MTAGEISLTGRVLPIGGIKEKTLAARRSDIKTLLFPQGNKKDWDELTGALHMHSVYWHHPLGSMRSMSCCCTPCKLFAVLLLCCYAVVHLIQHSPAIISSMSCCCTPCEMCAVLQQDSMGWTQTPRHQPLWHVFILLSVCQFLCFLLLQCMQPCMHAFICPFIQRSIAKR